MALLHVFFTFINDLMPYLMLLTLQTTQTFPSFIRGHTLDLLTAPVHQRVLHCVVFSSTSFDTIDVSTKLRFRHSSR